MLKLFINDKELLEKANEFRYSYMQKIFEIICWISSMLIIVPMY